MFLQFWWNPQQGTGVFFPSVNTDLINNGSVGLSPLYVCGVDKYVGQTLPTNSASKRTLGGFKCSTPVFYTV